MSVFFQSQMALVYNCNDNVAAAAFVSRLQVTHFFYKHLVKHEVTKMRDILSRTQKYIQIKDVTRSAFDRSISEEDKGEKLKSQPAFPKKNQNRASGTVHKQPPTEPCQVLQRGSLLQSVQDLRGPCLQRHQGSRLGEPLEATPA